MKTDKLTELYLRRRLAKHCISVLDQLPKTTPNKASAIQEYKRQLDNIEKKIAVITGTPPPVIVGLKTAKVFGNSGLGKE